VSSDPNCVFCKIVAGQIPAMRVYEDERVLAFLDIGPLAEGHLLVIPKDHAGRIDEMAPDTLAHLAGQLPRLARGVLKVTGAEGYNLLQNNGRVSGQEVPHVHFHIIPRKAGDGLGYRWVPSAYPAGRGEEIRRLFLSALDG
jgi:histidine triad (HIT) family protein